MSNGITAENLLRALPDVLQEDEDCYRLASVIAAQFEPLVQETELEKIYARIDLLDEDLLDILAYDFKVDWWDYGLSLTEKRETLKRSWYVHKHMGTPAAIKSALSAIYPDVYIQEWFDYGGEPYHFRIMIPVDETTLDMEKHTKVMSLVAFYKNLRSVLDSIEYAGTEASNTIWPMTAISALHEIQSGTATQSGGGDDADALQDELGEVLTDELNEILTD